jgi:RNA polymerase sigma factor for flagellar operon FliA
MHQVEQMLGRAASEQEVAQQLNVSIEEYRQILLDTNNSQLFSYDEYREEHGDSAELVTEGHEEANPLQMVLTLYYQEELNLKEIGAVLDVGESRVSQLHSQAIKRLRARLTGAR